MTPHNEAKLEDISETILMPGDPLRAKYIAENFLEDAIQVNSLRNMLAYTGIYKGKKVTVFPSGMGMPSIGIYVYELFKFYNVQNIIRIGTCGAFNKELNIFDTILVDKSYTPGNFAFSFSGKESHIESSSTFLNEKIKSAVSNSNLKHNFIVGNMLCSEVFDYYIEDFEEFKNRFPKELNIQGSEMEAFALFYLAKHFNRNASCLLTVVDSRYKDFEVSAEERETSLNDMIRIALEAATKL